MLANARRLAAAVKARRDQLDLNQLQVWGQGGPSNTTLTKIENARPATPSRGTFRKLDAGLRWEPGSARAVWDGTGEARPILRPSLTGRESAKLREHIEAAEIAEETRAALLEVLRDTGTE